MVLPGIVSGTETSSSNGYQVKLPLFEGPLDLLLFLIQRDQIDIHDIPIARITEEYLKYLQFMRFLHLDVAADFLVMAATLMSIKSQMLLPRPSPVAEFAQDDPRQELVQKLLEYRLYKTAAQSLADRETETLLRFARPGEPVPDEADQETVLLEVTLFDLISAFEQIIEAEHGVNVHEVILEEVTVKQCFDYILNLLQKEDKVSFEKVIRSDPRPMIMVVTFLALLELIRARRVSVRQKEAFGAIWIYRQPTAGDDDHPFQERS